MKVLPNTFKPCRLTLNGGQDYRLKFSRNFNCSGKIEVSGLSREFSDNLCVSTAPYIFY